MPRITQKGQVTIPKKIREYMGLRLGSQVDFQICQGKCILRKVIKDDYLEKWAGHLKIDKTTDQIIRELRGQ